MRTAAARKRSGTASLLLDHIIIETRRAGSGRLSLETGAGDFHEPARLLYKKFGFVECGPFGDYQPDPLSTFMTKVISR
jgi:putative acetyltransferase